jgi:hypothetical protein
MGAVQEPIWPELNQNNSAFFNTAFYEHTQKMLRLIFNYLIHFYNGQAPLIHISNSLIIQGPKNCNSQ